MMDSKVLITLKIHSQRNPFQKHDMIHIIITLKKKIYW